MRNIRLKLSPAVEAYLIGLIYCNTRTTCLSLSAVCSSVSHNTLGHLRQAGLSWSGRLWTAVACQLVQPGDQLVLDDTSWPRWAEKAEAVSFVWCGRVGQVIKGMPVVLLIWTDGHWKIPIGMRRWQKGGPSNIMLARELIEAASPAGLTPTHVLFDRWYAAAVRLNRLDELSWHDVAQLKSNRKLNGQPIRHRWRHRFGHTEGHLTRVPHGVRVVKHGRRFWVTHDRTLTPAQINHLYRVRQQIEETFRVLKQEFGWGRCRTRKADAQLVHLHLGLLALWLTQQTAFDQGLTIYPFKRQLFRQPIPDHLPSLQPSLVAA